MGPSSSQPSAYQTAVSGKDSFFEQGLFGPKTKLKYFCINWTALEIGRREEIGATLNSKWEEEERDCLSDCERKAQ